MLNYTEQRILKTLGKIYSPQHTQALLDNLINSVAWQQDFVAFGRHFNIPRLQAWYADKGIHYRYSDNMLESHRWAEPLLSIKQDVEKLSGLMFNSVLVTYYRNGDDHVSWHADDEPELGNAPVIASLSLGADREFQYRHKRQNESGSILLQDGELLLMLPEFQSFWEHSIPQQTEVTGPRINLTFRQVVMTRD